MIIRAQDRGDAAPPKHIRHTFLRGLIAAITGLTVIATAACSPLGDSGVHAPSTTTTSSPAPEKEPPPSTPSPDPPVTFSVVAAGDVLPHLPVDSSARTGSGYDFGPLLSGLDSYVEGADLALCHFEVPTAPPGTKLSGYPVFAGPQQLPGDLRAHGWDGCSTASNHSLDRGMAGIQTTLDTFDKAGLGHAGTARSQAEEDSPQWYELARGNRIIKVAHISAAYGTNGIPIPRDAPWSVELINTDHIIAQAKAARAAGAQVVIVSIHDGTEYVNTPTANQVSEDTALARSGQIDLVIGHHAHVPQPIVKLPGGPDGQGMWVAYGLGNMLSNQTAANAASGSEQGILLTATFTVPVSGPAHVGVAWTAITVDTGAGHKVRVIKDAMANPAGGSLSSAQLATRYARVRSAVGPQAPEATGPPTPTGDPVVVEPHRP